MTELFVTIRSGKIVNRSQVKQAFDLEDGRYMVKISKGKNRSSPQNRYYHGQVIPLVCSGLRETAGYDVDEDKTHAILKGLFLTVNTELPNGEIIPITGSTRKLTTEQFNEFIEKIQRWAAEYLSITIPDPGEQISIF